MPDVDFSDLRRARRAVRPIAGIVVNYDLDYIAQVAFHRLGIGVALAALNLAKSVARNELDLRWKFREIIP